MVRWKTLVGPKMSALGRLVALHCFICLFHTLVKMSAPAEYTWSVGSACERREKAEYARTLLTVHILLRSNISEEFSWAGKIGTFLLAGKNRNISPGRKKIQKTETWGSERSPKQTLCLGACETTRIDLRGPPPPSRPSSMVYMHIGQDLIRYCNRRIGLLHPLETRGTIDKPPFYMV